MRGGRADETVFVVNGVANRDLVTGQSTAGQLNARSVAEVNVATGAFDVRYGNALSGVVEVRRTTLWILASGTMTAGSWMEMSRLPAEEYHLPSAALHAYSKRILRSEASAVCNRQSGPRLSFVGRSTTVRRYSQRGPLAAFGAGDPESGGGPAAGPPPRAGGGLLPPPGEADPLRMPPHAFSSRTASSQYAHAPVNRPPWNQNRTGPQ